MTHHSFVAYKLPSTGEIVPMLQIAPSKTDAERLLLVSPELGEVLAEVIGRVRGGRAVLPLVSAYDPYERTWSPPMPFLFQRPRGPERRAISRTTLRQFLNHVLAVSGLTDASNRPLVFTPHDFGGSSPPMPSGPGCRRTSPPGSSGMPISGPPWGMPRSTPSMSFPTTGPSSPGDALFAPAKNTMTSPRRVGPVPAPFRAPQGRAGRLHQGLGTPCAHEHSCVRCPQLRPDPAQEPRLTEIRDNLEARIAEALRC